MARVCLRVARGERAHIVCMHFERSITRFVCLAQRPFVHASNELQSICMDQFKPISQVKTNRKVLYNCRICPFFTFELQRIRAAHIYVALLPNIVAVPLFFFVFVLLPNVLFLFLYISLSLCVCLVSVISTLFYLFYRKGSVLTEHIKKILHIYNEYFVGHIYDGLDMCATHPIRTHSH